MGILGKLFGGAGIKTATKIKSARRMLDAGKSEEAAELLAEFRAEQDNDINDDDHASLIELNVRLVDAYIQADQHEQALNLAMQLSEDSPEMVSGLAEKLASADLIDPRMLHLVIKAHQADPKDKRLLIIVSKRLLDTKGDDLDSDELEFVMTTAHEFALWKDGQGFLADHCLRENRRDACWKA